VIGVASLGSVNEPRDRPPFRAQGLGAAFPRVNRTRRRIAIDLETADGRALVHELARRCDVAIESLGTGVAERQGIDASTLQALADPLIRCSISGFGRERPLHNAPGYDMILLASFAVTSLSLTDDHAAATSAARSTQSTR
jgi:crotonobetainyl-CoA:carnitine CoA-transferase CaiB-like acyl-CoA transferase